MRKMFDSLRSLMILLPPIALILYAGVLLFVTMLIVHSSITLLVCDCLQHLDMCHRSIRPGGDAGRFNHRATSRFVSALWRTVFRLTRASADVGAARVCHCLPKRKPRLCASFNLQRCLKERSSGGCVWGLCSTPEARTTGAARKGSAIT